MTKKAKKQSNASGTVGVAARLAWCNAFITSFTTRKKFKILPLFFMVPEGKSTQKVFAELRKNLAELEFVSAMLEYETRIEADIFYDSISPDQAARTAWRLVYKHRAVG